MRRRFSDFFEAESMVEALLKLFEVLGALLLALFSGWLMFSLLYFDGSFPADLVPFWP